MKPKEVRERLGPLAQNLSFRKGVYTLKKSYFYGISKSGIDVMAPLVRKYFPNAVFVDAGNHYHDFVGGAKSCSAKDSYYWIKFIIPQE